MTNTIGKVGSYQFAGSNNPITNQRSQIAFSTKPGGKGKGFYLNPEALHPEFSLSDSIYLRRMLNLAAETLPAMEVKIEASWKEQLQEEFNKPYFEQIALFLKQEKLAGHTIYPPGPLIFNAFEKAPFDKVKVVILGQDPYHGPGQAHGLCFSVPDHIPPPPSLVNIFKELHADTGLPVPASGNLEKWARQGVLLLNAMLTVRANSPASHSKIGWENFTDAVIRKISDKKQGVVFILWGRFAQDKQALIDSTKHYVLKAAHPSPFSANNGFFGCRHFSRTNELLLAEEKEPVEWDLVSS